MFGRERRERKGAAAVEGDAAEALQRCNASLPENLTIEQGIESMVVRSVGYPKRFRVLQAWVVSTFR